MQPEWRDFISRIAEGWQRLSAWILQYFRNLPTEELTLRIISATILVLFLITILLAITVLILRLKNNLRAHRLHRLEQFWERLLMGIITADDEEDWPDIPVRRHHRQFFLQYLYRYSQRLQGSEMRRIRSLALPHLHVLTRRKLGEYPELRARNINILGVFGIPEFLTDIRRALGDRSPIVAMSAARSLARPDYPEHCRFILPVLTRFNEWSMSFLASMLQEMGPKAAPQLREAVADESESSRTRIACLEALRSLGDLPSAGIAVEVLEQSDDAELQAACLRLLGELGTPEHLGGVLASLHSSAVIVRIHALKALGTLGSHAEATAVEAALKDPSPWVVLHAVRTLARLGHTDLLQSLMESGSPQAPFARQILAEGNVA